MVVMMLYLKVDPSHQVWGRNQGANYPHSDGKVKRKLPISHPPTQKPLKSIYLKVHKF